MLWTKEEVFRTEEAGKKLQRNKVYEEKDFEKRIKQT